MIYEELLKIYHKRIFDKSSKFRELPINSKSLISLFNLQLKDSTACKEDYKEDFPLYKCDSFYAIFKGQATIYYDERHKYQNFFLAHELAHHILNHTEEHDAEFHDANLLAAIIVAPPHLIKESNIKSAGDLFDVCTIPIDIADEYWDCIKDEILENKSEKDAKGECIPEQNTTKNDINQNDASEYRTKSETYEDIILNGTTSVKTKSDGKIKQFLIRRKVPVVISAVVTVLLCISASLIYNKANDITANSNGINSTPQTTYSAVYINATNVSPTPEPTNDVIIGRAVIHNESNVDDNIPNETDNTINADTEIVFVTKYGKKYHKKDCPHIQSSSQIFEFSIEDAVKSGYEACKSCF